MSQKRIVIIGGTACGPKTAARARRCDPQAHITLIEQGAHLSTATCGLPYYISGVINKEEDLLRVRQDFFEDVMNVEVMTNTRALAIDRLAGEISIQAMESGQVSKIKYDKLVMATGSSPLVPRLEGVQLKGIHTLASIDDANTILDTVSALGLKHVVIVGAGLIGMEMAEAFAAQELDVTVIEALDWVLPTLLDFEVAAKVEKHLRSRGVKLLLGQKVKSFVGNGDGVLKKVITESAEIEAEMSLLSIGARPNIGLAKDAGITIGVAGGIAVNQYLQTSDPNIYAGGDCVENTNRITGKKVLVPMGSTANKHGRIIGTNITGGSDTFPGVMGTAVVKIFDYNAARVGLNESQARAAGYEIATTIISDYENASYYPGGKEILIKLVAEKSSGRLLGGQAMGPGEVAKRIDVLATAMAFKATVEDVANLNLAYAPPFSNAMDPLHKAANVIRNKISGCAKALDPVEVKHLLETNENAILLDVRSPGEWDSCRIETPQTKLLPLKELRTKLGSLPRDAEIVIYCQTGTRAYQAQRILSNEGFENVTFLDGGIIAWPYGVTVIKPYLCW